MGALVTRYELLAALHELLQPRGYLDIGVHEGRSLNLAACPAIGVDPAPAVTPTRPGHQIYTMTSDDFFAGGRHLPPTDLVSIDGMHLFEYALRDLIGVERTVSAGAVVVFDDVLPYNQAIAARTQPPGDWTGDVWKLHPILQRWRPDLSMLIVDVDPTGVLVVWGLDHTSTVLSDAYAEIVASMAGETVPDEYLTRATSVPPELVLEKLRNQ